MEAGSASVATPKGLESEVMGLARDLSSGATCADIQVARLSTRSVRNPYIRINVVWVRMAERSKALRSGRSPLLWAWVRIPLLTTIFFWLLHHLIV